MYMAIILLSSLLVFSLHQYAVDSEIVTFDSFREELFLFVDFRHSPAAYFRNQQNTDRTEE